MDMYEEAVMSYITAKRTRFLSPQFDIPYAEHSGGSCPDFVVLDYEDQTIYIVEVSSKSNVDGLIKKVAERDSRWISPLKAHFQQPSCPFGDWHYHVTIFVRDELLVDTAGKVSAWPDVTVNSLKDAVFGWNWAWDKKAKTVDNPLRS